MGEDMLNAEPKSTFVVEDAVVDDPSDPENIDPGQVHRCVRAIRKSKPTI